MPSVKLGVIGCGFIGSLHIEAATDVEQIDLIVIADLRRNLVEAMAVQFNVPTIYSDAQALITDPQIEAVVLAMPAFLRTPLALDAFACAYRETRGHEQRRSTHDAGGSR